MWYLHDEAPPYFPRPVTEWLNNHFPTSGSVETAVAWPPHSPDLSLCDFCLWGWMKQLVYGNQQRPETIESLQQRLEVAAATVHGTPAVFLHIHVNMLRRAEVGIASQGRHFQHVL